MQTGQPKTISKPDYVRKTDNLHLSSRIWGSKRLHELQQNKVAWWAVQSSPDLKKTPAGYQFLIMLVSQVQFKDTSTVYKQKSSILSKSTLITNICVAPGQFLKDLHWEGEHQQGRCHPALCWLYLQAPGSQHPAQTRSHHAAPDSTKKVKGRIRLTVVWEKKDR